jgi:hypothetical protein
MRTQTILILSLLFLLFADSCKKKCPELKTRYIEQEMKDWILYKPGSYWIYRDSISGGMDSVFKTQTEIEIVENFDNNNKHGKQNPCAYEKYESLTVYYESIIYGQKFSLRGRYGRGSGVQNNTNPVDGSCYIFNENHSGGDGGLSKYMFFPVLQGTKGAWNGYTIIEHDTIYKQYELNGQNYENVLRVSDGLNGAYNAITKFYHCKHIGVIKKEIYRFKDFNYKDEPELLHVWELVKYEVNQ